MALGTDGPMVDYRVDMVEQMKACTLMQHVRHLDPTRMPAERTIEMATINAAKALGLDERNRLARGRASAPTSPCSIIDKPYVGVLHRPISTFMCAGKGSDAALGLVDGEIVYRDGQFYPRCKDGKRVIMDAEKIAKKRVSCGLD